MKIVKRCLGGQRGNQANNAQDGLETPLNNGKHAKGDQVDTLFAVAGAEKKLELSGKGLDDTKMPSLAKAIIASNKAISLKLNKNSLGDPSCSHIADILDKVRLQVLELSSNEITGSGLPDLQRAITGTLSLRQLVLKQNNLGDYGARVVAAALRDNRSLLDLNLDQAEIGDDGFEHLASALKVNAHLKHLHLSRNKVGDRGMLALADMIAVNATLKELWLLDCSTSHTVAQEFSKAMQRNVTLQKFAFTIKEESGRKDLEEKALEEVKKSHKVRRAIVGVAQGSSTLNLSEISVEAGGVDKLAEVIASAPQLKDVKLEKCSLPPEGMEKIARALKDSQGAGLQTVSFSGTELSEKATESLVEVFQRNDGLQAVDLGNCGMSEKSTVEVASFVQRNTSLAEVHIGGNAITDAAAAKIADGIKHSPNLKDISMGGGALTEAGMKTIAEAVEDAPAGIEKLTLTDVAVSDKTAESLSQCIKSSAKLREIDFSNCSMGPKAGVAIADALGRNETVTKVTFAGTELDEEMSSKLAETLTANKAIVEVNFENCKMDARSVAQVVEALSENTDVKKASMGGNKLSETDRNSLKPLLARDVMTLEIQPAIKKEAPQAKAKAKPKAKAKGRKNTGRSLQDLSPRSRASPRSPSSKALQYVVDDQALKDIDAEFDAAYTPDVGGNKANNGSGAKQGTQGEDKPSYIIRQTGAVAIIRRNDDDDEGEVKMDDDDSEAWEWDDSQEGAVLNVGDVPDELDMPDDSGSDAEDDYRKYVVGDDDSDEEDDGLMELPSDEPTGKARHQQLVLELHPDEVPDDLELPYDYDSDTEAPSKQRPGVDVPAGPSRGTHGHVVEPLPAPSSPRPKKKGNLDYHDVPEELKVRPDGIGGHDDVQLADDMHLPEHMVPDELPVLDEGVGVHSDDEHTAGGHEHGRRKPGEIDATTFRA